MPTNDFYPSSRDARASWHKNLAEHIDDIKVKYGLSAAMVTQLKADADWIQHYVDARNEFDAASQQFTAYFNAIAGKDEAVPPPITWTYTIPGSPPADVPPGVETRAREFARQVKGHSSYATADGELVQIESPLKGAESEEDEQVEFQLETQLEFHPKATFKKKGHGAIRFEYRHHNGNWIPAATFLTSPGFFTVVPATPNTAEQVEVRAAYIDGNHTVGNFSDAKSAFVAP